MKQPNDLELFLVIDIIDDAMESVYNLTSIKGESFATLLLNYDEADIDDYDEVIAALMKMGFFPRALAKFDIDLKNWETPPAKPSIDAPPNLELMELLSYLMYVFLGNNRTLLVIVAIDLLEWKIDALVSVMKIFIKSIGQTIFDIVGFTLEICTYKIKWVEDCKPGVKH